MPRLPGLVVTDHVFTVPLDHSQPDGPTIEVLAREVVAAAKVDADLPWLIYLQGGPGAAFGLDLAPETRLYMYFFIGLTVFGVFGSFTYYLPELFPTRLRGTGVDQSCRQKPREGDGGRAHGILPDSFDL